MSGHEGYEYEDLIKFTEALEEMQKVINSEFLKACNQIGLRFVAKAKERTPIGATGNLADRWRYEVKQNGEDYEIWVYDPMEYASFVEYGHKQQVGRYVAKIGKRLVKPWVKGRFMMTLTKDEIVQEIPEVVQRIEDKMAEVLASEFGL